MLTKTLHSLWESFSHFLVHTSYIYIMYIFLYQESTLFKTVHIQYMIRMKSEQRDCETIKASLYESML